MLTSMLLLIFVMCVAFVFNSGLWSSAVTLFNVLFAALLATSYFEPLADWFDRQYHGLTYMWDFTALWLVFAAAYLGLRAATDFLSRVKVRFKRPFDLAGGIFFAGWVGWVMVCFTSMTLHASPLAVNFMSAFNEPDEKVFLGFAPDRLWLGFAQQTSLGALARSNAFDPQGDFIFKYRQRRVDYEKITSLTAGR